MTMQGSGGSGALNDLGLILAKASCWSHVLMPSVSQYWEPIAPRSEGMSVKSIDDK